jgi:uncharacterized protein YecE (DUF72 family)
MAHAYIGISGWRYGPWRGTFYPEDLAQKNELAYASRQVNSIEINGSFYSLQTAKSYEAWRDATPEDFVFSLKGPRYISHMKRLKNVEGPLANFFASGVLALGRKLGPILWQFPPNFQWDEELFDGFFELLPRTTGEAAEMAKRHDRPIKGGAWARAEEDRPIRYAVEIRHESFQQEAFVACLRRHKVALCVADTAGKWPFIEDVTAPDFVYARLHGDEQLYVSGYTEEALDAWAKRVRAWLRGGEAARASRAGGPAKPRKSGRDVYVYFDNDVKVRAPFDARGLMRRVGVPVNDGADGWTGKPVKEEARERWPTVDRRPARRASRNHASHAISPPAK